MKGGRQFASALVTVLGLLFMACAPKATPTSTPKAVMEPTVPPTPLPPIKIGFIVEMTGSGASMGERHIEGATLAVKQINASGGVLGRQIELIMNDDMSTTEGAVTAWHKTIAGKPVAVVGPGFSTMLQAMSPAVKEAGIPTMIGGSMVGLTKDPALANPWWFRVRAADDVSSRIMVEFITKDLRLSKIAILHDSEAFGKGGKDRTISVMKELNLEPTTVEQYKTGDKDFTAQLLSVKNSGAEVLVVWSPNSEDSAVILRQVRELNLPVKIVGSASFSTQVTLNIAKEAAEGMYSIQEFVADANPTSAAFRQAYLQEYGKEPDHFGAWTYDAVRILAKAIETAGSTDPEAIRQAILNLNNFEGALGMYNFNGGHDGMHTFHVITVENGKFKVIK